MAIKEELNIKNIVFGVLSMIAGAGGFKGMEFVDSTFFSDDEKIVISSTVVNSQVFKDKMASEIHRQVMQEILRKKENSKISLRSLISEKAGIPVDEVHIVMAELLGHRVEFNTMKAVYLPMLDRERRYVDVGIKWDKVLGKYICVDKDRQNQDLTERKGIIDGATMPYRMRKGRLELAFY